MANLYISKIKLTGGEYYVKDIEARELIAALSSATVFMGVSSTAITDGGSQKPTLGGESKDPQKGWIVIYNSAEFIYDGAKWVEFGDLSGLGDLAQHDIEDIQINVTTQTDSVLGADTTFTATAPTVTISGTTTGDALSTDATVSVTGGVATKKTLQATTSQVVLNTSSKTSVNTGYTATTKKLATESVNVVGSSSDVTVKQVATVGSLPTYTVENEVLTLTAGVLPTTSDVSVSKVTVDSKTVATGSVAEDGSGADIMTGITSAGTVSALTDVTVSAQPTTTLTAGEDGAAEVVTDVTAVSASVSGTTVKAVTAVGTASATAPTVTAGENDKVTAVTSVSAGVSYSE